MSRDAEAEPAESTPSVEPGASVDVLRAELGARDLQDHARHALADLGRGAVHLGGELLVRAGPEPHARRAGVVEALRVADVLEPDREADAALDALAAGGVAGAARQADRVARQLLGLGHGQRGGAADHLGHRQRARHLLPRRERVARAERVQEAQLDRVDLERGGELVHLRLVREAALDGAEAAHRAAGRVVRVDAGRLDQRVLDLVRAAGERGRVRADGRARRGVGAAVEQDPRADVDELAVAGRAVLHPDLRRVPVDVADERLLAASRRSSPAARCGARASRRGSASRGPRARRRRRRRRRGGCAPAPSRARGTARPGRGRRAATASPRRRRRRPRRRAPPARTPARGRPGPGSRARRRPRRSRRRRRPGRRGGSRSSEGRSAAGRPGSRGRRSGSRRGSAAARWRAPCRSPARAARRRPAPSRPRGAPARGARRRRARPARRSSAPCRSRAPAGRRTRARRSSRRARRHG